MVIFCTSTFFMTICIKASLFINVILMMFQFKVHCKTCVAFNGYACKLTVYVDTSLFRVSAHLFHVFFTEIALVSFSLIVTARRISVSTYSHGNRFIKYCKECAKKGGLNVAAI